MDTKTKRALRIAVADDSELVRDKIAQKMQKMQDIDVIWEAKDAQKAIENFEKNKPDILIIDVQLPGISGIEMLKKIKAWEERLTFFIVLTNYPHPILKNKSLEVGADYFFDKTTEFGKVIDVIKSIKENGTKVNNRTLNKT
jgi:DNA-binding NarL/FixJ family response regulator